MLGETIGQIIESDGRVGCGSLELAVGLIGRYRVAASSRVYSPRSRPGDSLEDLQQSPSARRYVSSSSSHN
jgi:hypothetical protein